MKKIFTLVAMAAMAIGVNAQDIWNAADEDWTQTSTFVVETPNSSAGLKKVTAVYPTEPTEAQVKADVDASLTLKDYIFTKTVGSVTIKGVSTPNSDNTKAEAWRIQGTNAGQQLNKKDGEGNLIGLVEWSTFVNAKSGNPDMEAIEYFFKNSNDEQVGPRMVESFWEPNCGKLPAKGEYIEVSFTKSGTFIVGLFLNKCTIPLYIIDKETTQLLPTSAIQGEGFNNNNTIPYIKVKLKDDYSLEPAVAGESFNNQGARFFGYFTFDVEAGKSYLMFNPKNQLGIYGFYFETTSGIANVKTIAQKSDAAIYNLAGQKVDAAFKGMVIQNGRKFINK